MSLLRISNKYDFHRIRREVVQALRTFYPDNLYERDSFKNRQGLPTPDFGFVMGKNSNRFKLLGVLRQSGDDANQILPTLFFMTGLSGHPKEMLRQGRKHLTQEDLDLLVVGTHDLREAERERLCCPVVLGVDLQDLETVCNQETDCGDALARACWALHDCDRTGANLLNTGEKQFGEHRMFAVCDKCIERMKMSFEDQRQKLWEHLPSFFGLPTWTEMAGASNP